MAVGRLRPRKYSVGLRFANPTYFYKEVIFNMIDKEIINTDKSADNSDVKEDRETTPPWLVEEIQIEELAVDGICGIY